MAERQSFGDFVQSQPRQSFEEFVATGPSPTGSTPQVESSIRYLTTEDYKQPPAEPGAVARFGKQYTQQTGINDLLDIIRASNRYGAPQEVAARGEKAKTALGHVVTGLRDEPARIGSELAGIWQSMLDPKQDTADMSMHMLGAVPMVGPAIQGFVQDVWAKKYPEAAADLAALATLTKGPKLIEAAGEALPGAMQAARTAAAATAGGLKGGLTAAVKRPPYGAALIGQALGGPKGAAIAAGLAKAPSVIRATIKGARTALADTAAAEAAAAQAARAAAMENVPPGVTLLSPDYFDRLRLGPGSTIPPAPASPDASFVRSVPAQYAQPEPVPPSRQLGSGPIVTPPPADASFVRSVPAEYPPVESPLVRGAQQAGEFTSEETARAAAILENVEPQAAPAAAPAKDTVPATEARAALLEKVDRINRDPNLTPKQQRAALYKIGVKSALDFGRGAEATAIEAFGKSYKDLTPGQQIAINADVEKLLAQGEDFRTPAPAAAPKPAAAELAQQFEATTRPDRMLDFLKRMDPEISAAAIDNLDPNQWELVARGAGSPAGTIPTPEDIAAVRGNLAQSEGASQITAKTPDEAVTQFEQNREIRKGPATATAPTPATDLETQLADSLAGKRTAPAPEGPAKPTASETRVETIAKHLAELEGLNPQYLATLTEDPQGLETLAQLGRDLKVREPQSPGEVQQIVDRVRQLRGEGSAAAPTHVQKLDPRILKFTETGQGSEPYIGDPSKPILVYQEGGEYHILDGHNRVLDAIKNRRQVDAVVMPAEMFHEFKREGIHPAEMKLAYARRLRAEGKLPPTVEADTTPAPAETPNSRPYVDQSILSPSGRVSGRAEAAAKARTVKELFGEQGLQRPSVAQPAQVDVLRRQAQELRDLAARGMKPRAYAAKAAELDAQAAALEAAPPEAPQTLRTMMEGEKPTAPRKRRSK